MIRSLCFAIGLVTLLVWAPLALAEPGLVVTSDPQSQPESITVAPDGALILGSMSKPVIYRAAKGATKAEVFIDVSSEGPVSFLGVLADSGTNTLWACQIMRAPNGKDRRSILRSFDLTTEAPKFAWLATRCEIVGAGADDAADRTNPCRDQSAVRSSPTRSATSM